MRLEDRYAKMETKELVKIISLDKVQYTQEAITAAKAELRKRGESKETLASMLTEAQEEKKAIEEKPGIMVNQLRRTKKGAVSRIINDDKSINARLKRFGICVVAWLILFTYSDISTSHRITYYLPLGVIIMSVYAYVVSFKLTKIYPHPSRAIGNLFFTFLLIGYSKHQLVSRWIADISSGNRTLDDSTIFSMADENAQSTVCSVMSLLLGISYIFLKMQARRKNT